MLLPPAPRLSNLDGGDLIETVAPRGFDPRWLTVCVTATGTFMSLLDSTIVNIALPSIMGSFGADVQSGQKVLTSYLLALAIVIPTSGYLAERVGMKRLYMITLCLFTLGSALCGFAWSLDSLILFRILQGLGGGMLQPLGMAIVLSVIAPRERGQFMAVLGLPMLLAPILGPTLGGLLVQTIGWRPIFTINIPIGIFALVLAFLLLRDTPPKPGRRFDALGWVLSAAAFSALLIGFESGPVDGWGALTVRLLLGAGALLLVTWIVVELTQGDPLLDLRLFRNPIFATSTAINFVVQFSLFGVQFLLPLFLQNVRGLGPMATGFILFPQAFASFLSMNTSGRLYNRLGPRKLAISGLTLLCFATYSFSHIDLNTPNWQITALSMLRGFSMGLCMMPVQTAAYSTVPREQLPRATAISNVLMRLFGAFSTAILSSILHDRTAFHLAALAQHIRPDSPGVIAQLRALHLDPAAAYHLSPEVIQLLYRVTRQAATIMAFDDAFLVMSAVSLAGIALACFIRDVSLSPAPAGAPPRPAPASPTVAAAGPGPAAAPAGPGD